MKVLISAYACEPHKGSEGGVGWNWAKQIAKFAEVWIITRANNKVIIEKELEKNPVSNLHFLYYDVPKWLSFWKKKTRGLYLYYFLWQIGVFLLAKQVHKREKFDIVHHLTFGNLWLPTFMPFLKIPFIWGPIGGGDSVPFAFRSKYSIKSKLQELFRDMIIKSLKFNFLFNYICRHSAKILTRTEETTRKIPKIYRHKITKMIETGIQAEDLYLNKRTSNNEIIQVISIGRLIHWKGFDMGLSAFAKANRTKKNMIMTIIGDGPDKRRLMRICYSEDIMNTVSFVGSLEHNKVLEIMLKSDILLQPSLKEGGSWVFFEAMSLGLPIISLDIAGSSEIVSEESGIKIKPTNPEQTINELAEALLKLANDPELRKKIGEAGRRRVMEHYTWEKKGEFIKRVYAEVLNITQRSH